MKLNKTNIFHITILLFAILLFICNITGSAMKPGPIQKPQDDLINDSDIELMYECFLEAYSLNTKIFNDKNNPYRFNKNYIPFIAAAFYIGAKLEK